MFSDGTKQIFKNKLYDVYRVKTKLHIKKKMSVMDVLVTR